jgi:septin family protein
MKTLASKTTVIPVISKADTITTAHMNFLKQKVSRSLKKAGLDPLEALNFDAADSDDDRLDERDEDENSSSAESEEPGSARSDDSEGHRRRSKKRPEKHNRQLSAEDATLDGGYVTWSILSPDKYSLESKDGPVGRQFPWGFADPYNLAHCDFVKLKEAVFGEWRSELREASREVVSRTIPSLWRRMNCG